MIFWQTLSLKIIKDFCVSNFFVYLILYICFDGILVFSCYFYINFTEENALKDLMREKKTIIPNYEQKDRHHYGKTKRQNIHVIKLNTRFLTKRQTPWTCIGMIPSSWSLQKEINKKICLTENHMSTIGMSKQDLNAYKLEKCNQKQICTIISRQYDWPYLNKKYHWRKCKLVPTSINHSSNWFTKMRRCLYLKSYWNQISLQRGIVSRMNLLLWKGQDLKKINLWTTLNYNIERLDN